MRTLGARTVLALACLVGCTKSAGTVDFGYGLGERLDHRGTGAVSVRWYRTLTPSKRGAYVPVETAVAAIDPRHGGLYVTSVGGSLFALAADGERRYRLEIGSPLESQPALDYVRDELYFGTERGELLSVVATRGEVRWTAKASGTIRRQPLLTEDAVFVITEGDVVEAFARADGSVLWRYEREALEGFLVAGHAGLSHVDKRLYAAFNDGAVVCLDMLDGSERWAQDTSRDAPAVEPGLPQYLDVDTTPVVIGDVVYAASFGAGLYALDAGNGSVLWRMADWTGIVGVAAADQDIVVSSADRGVARIDVEAQKARWVVPISRGTASAPRVEGHLVLFGESQGSFIALDVDSGEELSRIDATHGFEALAAVEGGFGYVVSNGGMLLALGVEP